MPGGYARIGRDRRRHRAGHAAGRLGRRRLGRLGHAGAARHADAGRRRPFTRRRSRHPAVARRRQPVLAGPLRRAGRGPDPAAARLSPAPGRDRRSRRPRCWRCWRRFLGAYGIDVAQAFPDPLPRPDRRRPSRCAGKVRDRFSVDGWVALRDLPKTLRQMAETVQPGDDAARAMACCCARSPASPGWCTRTCTASPAGAS